MAEIEQPRRKLIIKMYSRKCKVPEEDLYPCSEKRRKMDLSNQFSYEEADGSRMVSKVCELKNKKGYYAEAIWVKVTENPSESCGVTKGCELIRMKEGLDKKGRKREKVPEKPCDELDELKNKESEGVRVVSRKRKREREKVWQMDRCKKMQCWAMLKRLTVGRDAWAFKNDILDRKATRKFKCLDDIETKMKKLGYSEADEFADDIRVLFSHALQYPPTSEVHRTARRVSDGFELSWKTMKKKWLHEDKERGGTSM